jgi:hypothetical protein
MGWDRCNPQASPRGRPTAGAAGSDRLDILGTVANNGLSVTWSGTAITSFTGGTLSGIETLTADLAGGTDTLSYDPPPR